MQNVSLRVIKLHNVNLNALSIDTTEKPLLTRLSLQRTYLAVGLIKTGATQADVCTILTLLQNNNVENLDCQFQSPNHNVIENLWDEL